jgi:hypothetical protein
MADDMAVGAYGANADDSNAVSDTGERRDEVALSMTRDRQRRPVVEPEHGFCRAKRQLPRRNRVLASRFGIVPRGVVEHPPGVVQLEE